MDLAILTVSLVACTQHVEPGKAQATDSIPSRFKVPTELYGSWLNKTYVDKVKETRSTKEAQDFSDLCLATIEQKGDTTFMTTSWNFHEGGEVIALTMTSANKAEPRSDHSQNSQFVVSLNADNSMHIAYGDQQTDYIKYGPGTKYRNYTEILNEALFSGTYAFGDSTLVEFHNDGSLDGIDGYVSYVVNQDYIDAGMDYDKIYLTSTTGTDSTFGYQFHDDTLDIFRFGCLEYDPQDSTFCDELSRKENLYELIRK